MWRDAFGSDPDILGKPVSAEGMNLHVVGVTPEDFEFPEDPGFWYLMRLGRAFDNARAYRGFLRLRPDLTRAQLDAELQRLSGGQRG